MLCEKAEFDLDELARCRDQLWAEAVFRYDAGERWWPTADEVAALCRPETLARTHVDLWLPQIRVYLATREMVSASDVLHHLDVKNPEPRDSRRVTATLTLLGWKQSSRSSTTRFGTPGPKADRSEMGLTISEQDELLDRQVMEARLH